MDKPVPTVVSRHRVLRATPEEYVVALQMSDGWLRIRKIKELD